MPPIATAFARLRAGVDLGGLAYLPVPVVAALRAPLEDARRLEEERHKMRVMRALYAPLRFDPIRMPVVKEIAGHE